MVKNLSKINTQNVLAKYNFIGLKKKINEIKLILILNNESYSDDKRDQLHEAAVKSTIERNIKEIEEQVQQTHYRN